MKAATTYGHPRLQIMQGTPSLLTHDHFVTGGDRRRGGGEGVVSCTGHSPWMRAVRRIQTCASIIVSMRCRRFFLGFMCGSCQRPRRTGTYISAASIEIAVDHFVTRGVRAIIRCCRSAGYFRGVACCSSQRVASRYQSLKAVSGSMSARVSSALAVIAGSAS